ncbi:MAG: Ldh family oxidoreductase [Planctomycetaceae bacterium]|nr:Ldh family oxidoreductase [Planctomycetaceae bacterium]
MPILTEQFLRDAITRTFAALGSSGEDARIVADHLVDAELCGVTSHGIIRVPQYVEGVRVGRVKPDARVRILHEGPATAGLDGGNGFGQVMVHQTVEKALALAAGSGVGIVTLVNCGHSGRLGHYTEQAARQGYLAMMFVNAGGHGQWVAPFGGIAGRLSTNPFSMAAPSGGEFPVVLDVATSIAPEGKIRTLKTEGKPVPPGWIIDHQGHPTTQAADLYGPPRGAILPFGGHKGFGLSLLIDILAGGLSGAGCCTRADAPMDGKTDGILFIALRPDPFITADRFLNQVADLVNHVKSSPPVSGVSEVMVPGELEYRQREDRRRNGIPVDEEIWQLVEQSLL